MLAGMPRAASDQKWPLLVPLVPLHYCCEHKRIQLDANVIVLAVTERHLQSSASHILIIAYTFIMSKLMVYAETADFLVYAAQSSSLKVHALQLVYDQSTQSKRDSCDFAACTATSRV